VVEKMSGKDFDRPLYQSLLESLQPGDTLVVKSIDRLGRDYREIIEQWRYITKVRDACIVVIDMPLLDTRNKNHDLTGIFISDLVLQILSYVAETERNFQRQRQAEGISAARRRGTRFGRPHKKTPTNFGAIIEQWKQGEFGLTEALQKTGLTKSTFYRRLRDMHYVK